MAYVAYKSSAFTVRIDNQSGAAVVRLSDAASVYLQGDDGLQTLRDIDVLEDKWAEDDDKRIEFTDYMLSQWFN